MRLRRLASQLERAPLEFDDGCDKCVSIEGVLRAEARYAVRYEMARTLDDVLTRRMRARLLARCVRRGR